MDAEHVVKLETLAGGAMLELFEDAFQKVLENCQDVNTDAKAKRELTFIITVKPARDRSYGTVEMAVKSKLAAPRPAETTIFMGFDKSGKAVATEKDQTEGLFEQPKQPLNS